MARWEPGARERLAIAALDLYLSKGFDETTVVEIAQAAGLTERTFFRHFADKREVVFGGQIEFQERFTHAITAAKSGRTPFEIVSDAVIAAADYFSEERRGWSRQRQQIINANRELRERELLKRAALSSAMSEALRERGVSDEAAMLAAEAGVTVFYVSFARWLAPDSATPLAEIERAVIEEFGAVVSRS